MAYTRRFKFRFEYDYQYGFTLKFKEISLDAEVEDKWDISRSFEILNDDYHVFIFGIINKPRLLKILPSLDEAELYAKQQYTLATGNPPFIINNYDFTSFYKPNYDGSRLMVSTEGVNNDIGKIYDDDENNDFIFIIHSSIIIEHSLNPQGIW